MAGKEGVCASRSGHLLEESHVSVSTLPQRAAANPGCLERVCQHKEKNNLF